MTSKEEKPASKAVKKTKDAPKANVGVGLRPHAISKDVKPWVKCRCDIPIMEDTPLCNQCALKWLDFKMFEEANEWRTAE